MDKNQIAIATICWARNEAEEKLLKASLTELAKLQIPTFITDGGSSSHFLEFIRSFPHFTLLQASAKGVWAQARTSLLAAYEKGSSYIFYTEPDKLDFFRHFLPSLLREINLHKDTGILLAARSPTGFATFPPFQQMTETTINDCCAEVIGANLEFTYGPFLMRREVIPFLKLVQEDIGWGWRPYIFGIAKRAGYTVDACVNDFSCPPDQREDSPAERIYRMRQLTQNIQGLVLSTTVKIVQE
jgi:hypothetical protein